MKAFVKEIMIPTRSRYSGLAATLATSCPDDVFPDLPVNWILGTKIVIDIAADQVGGGGGRLEASYVLKKAIADRLNPKFRRGSVHPRTLAECFGLLNTRI